MKVLVTGASGFIGRALCARLSEGPGTGVVASTRSSYAGPADSVVKKAIGPDTQWHEVLESIDVVVHCAAIAHRLHGPDDVAEYRRVNVAGTLNLARQAADRGVRRFVFLSSVKVLGEGTRPGQALRADDAPAPVDAYARSKHEAEVGLARLAGEQGLEVVVLRPPLVYGPGVKANFLALMRWIHKGYPLPFGSVRNQRSLVAVGNLVDLVWTCCRHPAAANRTFMAADGEDLSTGELVRRLGGALGKPARLVPVPPRLLLAAATLAGKRGQASKLLGDFRVDTRETREILDWQPAVSVDQALERTARHFLDGLP